MNENARKDLKEGLLLYNTENNVGLKNAWNIIQAEVRSQLGAGGGASDYPRGWESCWGSPYREGFWRGAAGERRRVSGIWTQECVP